MLATFLKGATAAAPGLPLEFVGGTAVSSSTSTATPSFSLTSLTGGLASAPSIGDIVIACIAFKDTADRNIQCTTSGYTEVADLFANSSNDSHLGVYRKVLTEADTSVAFQLEVARTSRFAVHVWRNINPTPLDATTTVVASNSSGVPNAPSITTVTDNAIVIAVGAAAGASGSTLSNLTVPSGMENFFQVTASTNSCIGIASIARPSAGAYNPPAFGGGNNQSINSFCAVTLALRPA